VASADPQALLALTEIGSDTIDTFAIPRKFPEIVTFGIISRKQKGLAIDKLCGKPWKLAVIAQDKTD